MRFILMHKTCALWESGARPAPQVVAVVGALIGEMTAAGVLRGGDGLRASSEGVRVTFSAGARTIVAGPLIGGHELAAAFDIIRARSLDEAIAWASRQAEVLGDHEVDIRPVTEAWDIGLMPAPPDLETYRYMVLRKASAGSEAGTFPSAAQRAALSSLIQETSGAHLASAAMRPSARGRRLLNTANGVAVYDGPFVETKELLAGFVILEVPSLDDAVAWARRYIAVVETSEVDVLELE
jgi:hypothetical protein